MAPPFTPWLGDLIDTELESLIAWKSIVKQEPGSDDEDVPSSSRFQQNDSNFRSVVASPLLDPNSKLQLLQSAGQNSRQPLQVSDGETTVLAKLSDAAWDAYEEGLEDEDPMKGDLLTCKKITVISTSDGPEEKRVQLRIEDLSFTGDNIRKPIGHPTPVHQRGSVVESLKKIAHIRAKEDGLDDMDEGEDDEEDENNANEDVEDSSISEEDVPLSKLAEQAAPTASTHESSREQPEPDLSTLPRDQAPDKLSRSSDAQIESQLPVVSTQTRSPQQPRKPVKRNRGGGNSMGREGFEVASGINLVAPQAPMFQSRRSIPSEEPVENPLLAVINNMRGPAQRQRSPEPSAPVSAQVVREEIVTETPITTKKRPPVSTTSEPTQIPSHRKRLRVPLDQQKLLEDKSSWIPSASDQQFPHPNVPIVLLQAWKSKVMSARLSSQSTPLPTAGSGTKSVEEVHPEPDPDMANEPENESDEESIPEDPPIPWSSSPPRQPELPPDSSANHSSAHAGRAVSMNSGRPDRGTFGTSSDIRRDIPQSSAQQQSSLNRNGPRPSQPPDTERRGGGPSSVHSTPGRNTSVGAQPKAQNIPEMRNTIPSRPNSTSPWNNLKMPSSSIQPHQTGSVAQSGKAQQITSQSASNDPQGMADNHQGPVRPSTQHFTNGQNGATTQRTGMPPPSNTSAPANAPTGPRAQNRPGNSQYRKRRSTGSHYRSYGAPPSSNRHSMGSQHVPDRLAGATQPPQGTNEMETAVPRALQSTHDVRRAQLRDEQRRHWLDKKLSSGHQIPKLPSLVWRAYREEYTNDPVSQKSFEALLQEYRPSPPSTTPLQQCEDFVAAMRTNGEYSERNAGESDANGRLLAVDNHHETRRQREAVRDYQPVQEGVFTEFVEAWKNVMPGRFRLDNNTVSTRLGDERQRRGLDVLSWGFGE